MAKRDERWGPWTRLGVRRTDGGRPGTSDGAVDEGGIRNPFLVSKERRSETPHLRLHAPCFYPTAWMRLGIHVVFPMCWSYGHRPACSARRFLPPATRGFWEYIQ